MPDAEKLQSLVVAGDHRVAAARGEVTRLAAAAAAFADASQASSTRRAYKTKWLAFER